ncbi:FMN-binding protein [Streptomyces xanthii]|uniref:FMN-binding protein n=1 Tax=Streptomyces xanthii TaxID=2768069 RepID=A0A7H1B0P6_9ACTN|nr:FMN-binding protein [Streptomyces xanthii]QNS02301.1 FMN-binding protein [Streptomyces xanthii]
MRAHSLRRTLLTCVATVTVTVLALSLKPHHVAPAAAPVTQPPPSSSTGGGTSPGTGTRTVTGSTVQTRYGPVQVQVTLDGSKITSARALQQPDGDSRSREINASAIPVLVQETVKAQSAQVDAVSGATYTSEGYMTSLQSALDQAHA